ncbi:hypothetical protein ACFLXJ_01040 [Chloroflexota bacterium]
MILRSLVCDAVVNYFESEDWKELVRQMARGKEVRHAHAYADSILHPEPLLKIVEEYFKAHGLPLQRKIYLISPLGAHGMTDIYNIHPKEDWGHCELILRYSEDYVLAPMAAGATRTGKSVEVWDDAFMEKHYAKYDFKTKLTREDERDIIAYFDSPEWKMQYNFMLEGTNRHAHSLVETSIHPEIIQEFAIKAIETKGWEVSKSVSIVYGMRNFDFGKLTILVKKPEIMLELEWDYNPNVSIRAGAEPIIIVQTQETLIDCMDGLDYIKLDEPAVQEIIERLKAKV